MKRYNKAERKILSLEGFEAWLLAILLSSREGIEEAKAIVQAIAFINNVTSSISINRKLYENHD